MDIINDELPKADIIICRDCLVHFPTEGIFKAIGNFKKSGSTYLLTTTFTADRKNNIHAKFGDWNPFNLEGPPFNFPKPITIINENCTEANCLYTDKSLGLWKLSDL